MARSAVCGAAFIVVLLCVLITTPYVINATVTCGQVVTLLTPCIPFGVFGGTVPPECCAGIKGLHDAQNTAEDRRTACSCIQQGAALIPGIDYDRINTLGDRCGSPCQFICQIHRPKQSKKFRKVDNTVLQLEPCIVEARNDVFVWNRRRM